MERVNPPIPDAIAPASDDQGAHPEPAKQPDGTEGWPRTGTRMRPPGGRLKLVRILVTADSPSSGKLGLPGPCRLLAEGEIHA
jgi:hypothetical protein